jgi:hypothetical protein
MILTHTNTNMVFPQTRLFEKEEKKLLGYIHRVQNIHRVMYVLMIVLDYYKIQTAFKVISRMKNFPSWHIAFLQERYRTVIDTCCLMFGLRTGHSTWKF